MKRIVKLRKIYQDYIKFIEVINEKIEKHIRDVN